MDGLFHVSVPIPNDIILIQLVPFRPNAEELRTRFDNYFAEFLAQDVRLFMRI